MTVLNGHVHKDHDRRQLMSAVLKQSSFPRSMMVSYQVTQKLRDKPCTVILSATPVEVAVLKMTALNSHLPAHRGLSAS